MTFTITTKIRGQRERKHPVFYVGREKFRAAL